jgi:hypothetical protein
VKREHTGVWLSVPQNFDPSLFPSLKGLHDEAFWFLHKIVTAAIRHKHDAFFDGLVNISRRTMKTYIADRHVDTVRKTLIDAGVVLVDSSYRVTDPLNGVQGYSQSYGLTEPYAGELRRVEVMKPSLAAKIKLNRIHVAGRAVSEFELDHTLTYLHNGLTRTKIDANVAYDLIEQDGDDGRKTARKKVGSKRRGRKIVTVAIPNRKALNRMVVDTIQQGEWEWKVDDYGRLHTNVTRLLSACRSCLTIDGEKLGAIDVKNSQLIFLLMLLLEGRIMRSESEQVEGRIMRSHSIQDVPSVPTSSTPQTLPVTYQTQSHTPASYYPYVVTVSEPETKVEFDQYEQYLTTDERTFRDEVLNGTIYDNLMSSCGYTDRKKFKADFFLAVLYGDPKEGYSRSSPITRQFRRRFPNVWDFIVEQKKGDEPKAYAKLAHQMQIRESRFMIGRVCGRLAKHHGDIGVVTIHDSILCPLRHVATVQRIIIEEFGRMGITPTLHVEGNQQVQQAA